jgi:hypothetical protein
MLAVVGAPIMPVADQNAGTATTLAASTDAPAGQRQAFVGTRAHRVFHDPATCNVPSHGHWRRWRGY